MVAGGRIYLRYLGIDLRVMRLGFETVRPPIARTGCAQCVPGLETGKRRREAWSRHGT